MKELPTVKLWYHSFENHSIVVWYVWVGKLFSWKNHSPGKSLYYRRSDFPIVLQHYAAVCFSFKNTSGLGQFYKKARPDHYYSYALLTAAVSSSLVANLMRAWRGAVWSVQTEGHSVRPRTTFQNDGGCTTICSSQSSWVLFAVSRKGTFKLVIKSWIVRYFLSSQQIVHLETESWKEFLRLLELVPLARAACTCRSEHSWTVVCCKFSLLTSALSFTVVI